jgi:hypothetical protein
MLAEFVLGASSSVVVLGVVFCVVVDHVTSEMLSEAWYVRRPTLYERIKDVLIFN